MGKDAEEEENIEWGGDSTAKDKSFAGVDGYN